MICVKAPIRQVACFTKAESGSEAHRCRPFLSKTPPSAAIRPIFLLGKEKTAAYKSILFTVIKLAKEIFMEPNENSLNVKVAALPLLQCKEQTLAQIGGANSRELIRLLTLYGKASCSRPEKPDP